MTIKSRLLPVRRLTLLALLGVSALTSVSPAHALPWTGRGNFATTAFRDVWTASDRAVANGEVSRSYTWGPNPWFDYNEFYKNAPNGLRQVQYFDKARMEINNPSIAGAAGVTNGLLTVEMVSGRLKVGNGVGAEDNQMRQPANVPVAGDPGNENPSAPTYASFRGVATVDNGYRDRERIGQRVLDVLDKAGNRSTNAELAKDAASEIVTYNTITGHNVPRVFRDFIQNGPFDGTFTFGYPITDPYWVRAKVGGVEKNVLVQLYERRVITYTLSNQAAYRVEMGNVGQHYFQWRYPHLGQPWQPNADQFYQMPITYASQVSGHWEVFLLGDGVVSGPQITAGREETVPYSWRRSFYLGEPPRLMTDSKRLEGMRKLFTISSQNFLDVQQHSPDNAPMNFFNGAVSPDGTQVVMATQAGTYSSLLIQTFGQHRVFPAPLIVNEKQCNYQSPSWLPNGSGLVFASNCEGKFAIYRADLRYDYVTQDNMISASLVNISTLTDTTVDSYFPRVSPDGSKIVFSSNRNGLGDIYTINIDGSGERRITNDPADDGAATWNADGTQLIFDSNRDGDYELYRTSLFESLPNAVKLTNNRIDDRWPLWVQ